MIFPYITGAVRPSQVGETKDQDYDVRFGRYYLQCCNNPLLLQNIYKYILNWNFYKDNQWIFAEDLEPFLKDTTNDVRNRLRITYNIIKPAVHARLGKAIRSSFKWRAFNASPEASEKKLSALTKQLIIHQMASAMPLLKDRFDTKYNLGENIEETEDNFNYQHSDATESACNALIRKVEDKNQLDEILKMMLTVNLDLAGITISKEYFRGKMMFFEPTDPAFFFYDTSAKMPDLSDAQYMGEFTLDNPSELYEMYPKIRESHGADIEKYMKTINQPTNYVDSYVRLFGYPTGKLPRYQVYWHDSGKEISGYVENELGIITNELVYPDGTKDENGENYRYYYKDVIARSDLPEAKQKECDAKGFITKYPDVIRFINFIPKEIIGSQTDAICESGTMKYQETYEDEPFDSAMPYKVATFQYKFGEIITPHDSDILPQRMMNRYASMMEAMYNNARGANVIYEKSLFADEPDGEKVFLKNMNQSKPVGVDASKFGGNLQNLIIPYNATSTIAAGQGFINAIESIKRIAQYQSGMNDDTMGMGEGDRKPAQAYEQNISQSDLLNEGFFANLDHLYKQMYKSIANRGRRFFAENEYSLYENKDGVMKTFYFTKSMKLEEIGISLRRVSGEETNITANNLMLFKMIEMGLIGDEEFGVLFNRSELDQIASMVRQFSRKKQIAAKQTQEENSKRDELAAHFNDLQQQRKDAEQERKYGNDQNIVDKQEGGKNKREQDKAINKLLLKKIDQQTKLLTSMPQLHGK